MNDNIKADDCNSELLKHFRTNCALTLSESSRPDRVSFSFQSKYQRLFQVFLAFNRMSTTSKLVEGRYSKVRSQFIGINV